MEGTVTHKPRRSFLEALAVSVALAMLIAMACSAIGCRTMGKRQAVAVEQTT